jgi:hypothetical protein
MRNFENVSTSGLGAIPIPAGTVQESNESYAALMFKRQPVLAFRLKGGQCFGLQAYALSSKFKYRNTIVTRHNATI